MTLNANPLLLGDDDGYFLTRSLRFRSSASAYLNRTFGVSTSNTTFTLSAWVKRGTLGSSRQALFTNGGSLGVTILSFSNGTADTLDCALGDGTNTFSLTTTQVFRDPAAWYHIVWSVDTTQATAANRNKLYVNGTQVTSFGTATYPAQNANVQLSSSNNALGRLQVGTQFYFDGYMAEVNFIDGQALTPSSFGASSPYNQWLPKKYAGTYGTNGFYLPFTNNASTTTLGYDFSPQGNNWTTNNISVTTGSTYDSTTDVPTLTSATAANYCVINPLDGGSSAAMTISDGNLKATAGTGWFSQACTIGVTSGKFYWEQTIGTGSFWYAGIIIGQANWSGGGFGQMSNGYSYYSSGQKQSNGIIVSYGSSYTTGDVIGVALDMDAGTITFYKNNTSQGIAYTGLTGVARPAVSSYNSGVLTANFGQQPFTYTPPSGYVALNTFNL
jgi:hypothetical protein